MNEWKCRNCNRSITGQAHLRLGRAMTRGSNALCITCADALQRKYKSADLTAFVPSYIRANQGERSNQAALRAELAELRALVEELTRPQAS